MQKSTGTRCRNKWPQAVMNALSIERLRIGRREKIEKGHKRARESEWDREKRDWQWRMEADKDIYRVICYYRRRETNSFFFLFFFLQRNKDTHQFKLARFLDLTFSLCSPFLLSIHHTEEEDTPPGASWVILRGRKRGDGERMVVGPFVIYCSLSPSAPQHTYNLWGQLSGPPRSIGAVPDGCTGSRERKESEREAGRVRRQRLRSGCLTVFITVN